MGVTYLISDRLKRTLYRLMRTNTSLVDCFYISVTVRVTEVLELYRIPPGFNAPGLSHSAKWKWTWPAMASMVVRCCGWRCVSFPLPTAKVTIFSLWQDHLVFEWKHVDGICGTQPNIMGGSEHIWQLRFKHETHTRKFFGVHLVKSIAISEVTQIKACHLKKDKLLRHWVQLDLVHQAKMWQLWHHGFDGNDSFKHFKPNTTIHRLAFCNL